MSRPDDQFDPPPDSRELAPTAAGTGLITQPRDRGLAPALMAEQQRAKSEIEAALTIAAARPRDEKLAMDNILISCQRPGLAEKSQYEYSRGGTKISGASIVLMEAIAQRYGNLEFGFRELARYPASGGEPGESIVEAFAWDMQTNTRRKVQFSVQHAMKSGNHMKTLTDPRDIYEYVANQAQRRVRTCLENIIPRDIVEAACEECDKTLKASIADIAKATADMLKAFAALGVSKEMIESRIQRRIDSITPAQIIGLRKIYSSLKDGMSEPENWFTAPTDTEPPKSPAEQAKDAMRKKSKQSTAPTSAVAEPPKDAPAPAPASPSPAPQPEPTESQPDPDEEDEVTAYSRYIDSLRDVDSLQELARMKKGIPEIWTLDHRQKALNAIEMREAEVRGERGGRSNKKGLFDNRPAATEAGG